MNSTSVLKPTVLESCDFRFKLLSILFPLLLIQSQVTGSAYQVHTSQYAEMEAVAPSDITEFVYYIWDSGDGRWIPTSTGRSGHLARVEIPWFHPGSYQSHWQAVSLSGRTYSDTGPMVTVIGKEPSMPGWITTTGAKGSNGQTTRKTEDMVFGSLHAPEQPYDEGWIKVRINQMHAVSWVVLDSRKGWWPRDFVIQISEDQGQTWYPVTSANFVHFPDAGERSVWIPLQGAVANAVRVLVKRGNSGASVAEWGFENIRLTGSPSLPWEVAGPSRDRAAWNNLWLNFGIAANEVHERFDPWWPTDRPLDGGMVGIGSCEWLGWNALKLSWLGGHHRETQRLVGFIANNPIDDEGYAWTSPVSPRHLEHSRHYTTNACYISAVAHHYLMTRDPSFLEKRDSTTGESVLSKARRAMDFQLNVLMRDNLLVITDPENDGTAESLGNNYWDFWLFGYKSAYQNALFYHSLQMAAELEEALGEHGKAAQYRDLLPKVRQAFNDAFWNSETGRYIGWEDVNGIRYDYGFTFVNVKALAFGMADDERAASVLSWMDGIRTVVDDDAQDVYAFGFAPRSNTVEARRGDPLVVNTWNGALNIAPGGNAAFGLQIQNGGAIFYVSYYDLHARLRYSSPADAYNRWLGIRTQYEKDQLRRDPGNFRGHSDVVGILREFPESGLVPYFFIDGVLGAQPVSAGLRITPGLPVAWDGIKVREFHFAGIMWEITIDRSATRPRIEGNLIRLPATGSYLLTSGGRLQSIPEEL